MNSFSHVGEIEREPNGATDENESYDQIDCEIANASCSHPNNAYHNC
jgi:hypothetical protein